MTDAQSRDGVSLKDLYQIAIDTRNMEIGLFWQRCNYFLVLNSALIVGYFNLHGTKLLVGVAALGVVVCILWLMVAVGSKFWQQRWEECLRSLETRLIADKQFPPDIRLFSLEMTDARLLVETGLRRSASGTLQPILNDWVLRKPSVTQAMTWLAVLFAVCWLLLALSQLPEGVYRVVG